MVNLGDKIYLAIIVSEENSIGRVKIPLANFEITHEETPVEQAIHCVETNDCEIFFRIPSGFKIGINEI